MYKTNDRFKKILEQKQVSYYKVSKDLLISKTTLGQWKRDIYEMPFSVLEKINKYYNGKALDINDKKEI